LLAVHEATRALLDADSPSEVVDVVLRLVAELGGRAVPARIAGSGALPWDLSFGVDEPLLPMADPTSVPRLHLEALLPAFLEDARRVVMDLRHRSQLRHEATQDALTGLMNRRALDRQLHRLRCGDALAMIDFDHFKRLNDTAGHAAGDAVLACFGQLLLDRVRVLDLVARYGGEEITVAAFETTPETLVARVEQVRRAWSRVQPFPVTFSAGVAAVTTTVDAALLAADTALYQAKTAGRDQTRMAT
jgi:diguanylate cyclase (GGDEF)-like protein